MPYEFLKDRYYRMPTHFGPFPGPRQIPKGKPNDPKASPKRLVASVVARTERDAIEPLLPPGFTTDEEPLLIVEMEHLKGIDWLAGRGYNTFGVRIPVRYRGRKEQIAGNLLLVLWENLADPIISGREELGFSKLYCELPDPAIMDGSYRFTAGWLGHPFFDMQLTKLGEAPLPPPSGKPTLHFKYIPRTGVRDNPDAAYVTMTPSDNPNVTIECRLVGKGKFRFIESRWEDLPTLYHIVNAFASLPLSEFVAASLTWSHGGKDLNDQRIVE